MIESERQVESPSVFEPRGPPGNAGIGDRGARAIATHPGPSPNAVAAPRAERRQLTILFCDLVGSTELSTKLDPEDFRDAIATYHRCVADTVREFDGFVALLLGDGAVVYFGYPNGHEDNAVRAIRAGLALVSRVGELARGDAPLYAEERTKMVVETGLAPPIEGGPEYADAPRPPAIPATRQDSLMVRLDRLNGGMEDAQLCAALERESSCALLPAASDMDDAGLDLAQLWSQRGKGRQVASLLAEVPGARANGIRTRDLDHARAVHESLKPWRRRLTEAAWTNAPF